MKTELSEAFGFVQAAMQRVEQAKEYSEHAVSSLGKAIHNLNCAKGKAFTASNQVAAGNFAKSRLANELESIGHLVQDIQRQLEKMQMVGTWANGTGEELNEVCGGLLLTIPKEHGQPVS